MKTDRGAKNKIAEAAGLTPDPPRVERCLLRLLEASDGQEQLLQNIEEAASLFSASQFLANYCIANPGELVEALDDIDLEITKERLSEASEDEISATVEQGTEQMEAVLRAQKKRFLLRITLRCLAGKTDMLASMDELTALAEHLIGAALELSISINKKRFGDTKGGVKLAVIGVGKLGGMELNYSSDVDLLFVYREAAGKTSGLPGSGGTTINRLDVQEFYGKVAETLSRLLGASTEDGVAYRVDLRLRPQGQRGELAMSLGQYRSYYESWGRTWERMALIRARPVAGDPQVGEAFMEVIQPFVWREAADYSEIEEIRALKKMIDAGILSDNIKKGHGGIREAEFFVQTFQLIYGAKHEAMRTYRLLNAIQGLRRLKVIPEAELTGLWESYMFLRRVEHYLQMRDDVQTFTIPSSEDELKALAFNMGFRSGGEFLSELRIRRMLIRNMYNSLLGTTEDVHAETLGILEGILSEAELRGYLSFRKVEPPEDALLDLKRIREHMAMPRTPGERGLMRKALPGFLEKALRSKAPGRALSGMERLFSQLGIKEAYLSALLEKRELEDGMVAMFALAPRLTGIFMSSSYYLNQLIEDMPIRRSLRRMASNLDLILKREKGFSPAVARFRGVEEIRLGMFFLAGIMQVEDLQRKLSHVAEAVVGAACRKSAGKLSKGFAVIGMGKLGGREITFGSDLDMVFVSETEKGTRFAEEVIGLLTEYSERGMPYEVDARLRPDGTKGMLVKDVGGYVDYYRNHAQTWELQALIKARPIAGDPAVAAEFMRETRLVLKEKAGVIRHAEIKQMRERIMQELSRESEGVDLKLGPGGIEDIEFHTQWLQIRSSQKHPGVLVQGTVPALKRLASAGATGRKKAMELSGAYRYYRMLETFLRLNNRGVLEADGETAGLAAAFMGLGDADELMQKVASMREKVAAMAMKG